MRQQMANQILKARTDYFSNISKAAKRKKISGRLASSSLDFDRENNYFFEKHYDLDHVTPEVVQSWIDRVP